MTSVHLREKIMAVDGSKLNEFLGRALIDLGLRRQRRSYVYRRRTRAV